MTWGPTWGPTWLLHCEALCVIKLALLAPWLSLMAHDLTPVLRLDQFPRRSLPMDGPELLAIDRPIADDRTTQDAGVAQG